MSTLRLDRLISIRLFQPMRHMVGSANRLRIPILMYHSIREGRSDPRPYFDINTSPKQFEQHMKFLRDAGFHAIPVNHVLKMLTGANTALKYVAITFDDGYRDFATAAYPLLSAFKQTATLFVSSGLIGTHRKQFLGRELLTWGELRELQNGGIQIGSHSVTHRQLKVLAKPDLEDEVLRSKKTIEERLGQPVTSFSYPYAFPEADSVFSRTLRDMLTKHGYESGVTTILGTANRFSDRFLLPRLPINSQDDLALFRAKLEGSYDWLHKAQFVTKKIKQLAQTVIVPSATQEFRST